MAELRRNDRPEQPEHPRSEQGGRSEIRRLVEMQNGPDKEARPSADRGLREIRRLVEMQNGPEKATQPSEARGRARIQQILDVQDPPKRRGFVYDAPDKRTHSPEKPSQRHPDITGPYGPMSEITKEAREEQSDSRASNPFDRLLNKVTRDVDAWSENSQKAYEAIQHRIDPNRPSVQQTSTVVGQPNRAVYSPQAKDSPNDVVSHTFTIAVFLAEVGRRTTGLIHSHRKADAS